jgi:hypothetical protein
MLIPVTYKLPANRENNTGILLLRIPYYDLIMSSQGAAATDESERDNQDGSVQ